MSPIDASHLAWLRERAENRRKEWRQHSENRKSEMIAFETCGHCGNDFVPRHRRHRACSIRCQRALHYRENAARILLALKNNYANIRDKKLARMRAKYKTDEAYRKERAEKNHDQYRARSARYFAMGLNANGKPRRKRGRKPKAKSQ